MNHLMPLSLLVIRTYSIYYVLLRSTDVYISILVMITDVLQLN